MTPLTSQDLEALKALAEKAGGDDLYSVRILDNGTVLYQDGLFDV